MELAFQTLLGQRDCTSPFRLPSLFLLCIVRWLETAKNRKTGFSIKKGVPFL
jgi:hypothetical protein